MSNSVAVLTESTFDEEVGASSVPVLVEFWAEWCSPCKALAPVVEEVALEHADRLRVYKVNSDEEPALAARYEVMSVPTLLVFDDARLVKRMVGARGKRHLLEEVAGALGSSQVTTSSAAQSDGSPS